MTRSEMNDVFYFAPEFMAAASAGIRRKCGRKGHRLRLFHSDGFAKCLCGLKSERRQNPFKAGETE
jgi:hypothetical protein